MLKLLIVGYVYFNLIVSKALVQYLKDNNITIYVLTLIIVIIYFYID